MKKWIFVCLLLLIVVSSGVTVYIFSQPSGTTFSDEEREERLEQLLGRDVRLTNTTPKGNTTYDGKKVAFSYPAKAEVYEFRETSTNAESSALDDFSFDMTDPRIIFNLKVAPTHINSLSDYPAVRLREARGEYTKSESQLGEASGIYFSKEDTPEISAFYLYSGHIYTISVTGSSYEHVVGLFGSIVGSAKLK